ncbi:hypothetical protein CLU79DRAFT_751144 [Phycomyces nitens]|nr:hypothetical protein CLU79DRAFT_751144 [Phycomyces nitens]
MEDEQEICRVCRSESTPDHPLFHPCKCSGSIRFIHQDCLSEWLSHSKKDYCELCEYRFTFSPIYREDMPRQLPLKVLFRQLLFRLGSLIKTALRGVIVTTVWLIALPLFTLWMWRLCFWTGERIGYTSEPDAGGLVEDPLPQNTTFVKDVGFNLETIFSNPGSTWSFLNKRGFWTDCFEGQIITASVIVVFVTAYLFREWVIQNMATEEEVDLPDQAMEFAQPIRIPAREHAPDHQLFQQQQFGVDALGDAADILQARDRDHYHQIDQRVQPHLQQIWGELEEFQRPDNSPGYDSESDSDNGRHQDDRSIREESPLHGYPTEEDNQRDRRQEYKGNAGGVQSSRQSSSNHPPPTTAGRWDANEHTWPNPSPLPPPSRFYEYLDDMDTQPGSSSASSRGNASVDTAAASGVSEHDMSSDGSHHEDQDFEENNQDIQGLESMLRPIGGDLGWLRNEEINIERFRNQILLDGERFQRPEIAQNRFPRGPPIHPPRLEPIQQVENIMNGIGNNVNVNGNGNGNGNADEDEDAQMEDEPFDMGEGLDGILEAIGMRGNPWMLIQNSVLMSLMICLCIIVAVWIPYAIGRLVILIQPISFIQTPIYIMRLITDPLVDFTLDRLLPAVVSMPTSNKADSPDVIMIFLESLKSLFEKAINILSEYVGTSADQLIANDQPEVAALGFESGIPDLSSLQEKAEHLISLGLKRWHQFAVAQTAVDRMMCIFVGYVILVLFGTWYLSRRNQTAMARRAGAENTLEEIIHQQGIFLKVVCFIGIELIAFPMACGVLLDISTLPLFPNASIASRFAFYQTNPLSSYFLHWFAGTGFLFHIAALIALCRKVIRPGVLWFIRDPNDPQFHPVQEMVERPTMTLIYKISHSAMMYSIMVLVGVGVPTYGIGYYFNVYPLRWSFDIPLSTLAVDLVGLEIILPLLIQQVNLQDITKDCLLVWWRLVSRLLRLSSFMLGGRYPEEEGIHVRKTLKAWLMLKKANVPDEAYSDVAISDQEDECVVFEKDGMLVRVPKLDGVPVVPDQPMVVPVDPVTFEAINEADRLRGHPAASGADNQDATTTVVYIPSHFKARVITFLILLWISICIVLSTLTIVPLVLGRYLFSAYLAPTSRVHDLYSFVLGAMVILGVSGGLTSALKCREYFQSDSAADKIASVKRLCITVAGFLYMGIALGVVTPLLLGIMVELYAFIPISCTKYNDPITLYISQDWLYGVVYMCIARGTIYVLPNNRWQRRLDQIFGNDPLQLNPWTVTRSIAAPVIMATVAAISIPGIVAWGLTQFLGNEIDRLVLLRFIYPAVLLLLVLVGAWILCSRLIKVWLRVARDDAYLVGKQLHNLDSQ